MTLQTDPDNLKKSSKAEELFGNKGGFVVRHSNSIIFSFVTVLLLVCWIVPYPDSINIQAEINRINAQPIQIVNCDTVSIIMVEEGQEVIQGDTIAYCGSKDDYPGICALTKELDSFMIFLNEKQSKGSKKYIRQNLNLPADLQSEYLLYQELVRRQDLYDKEFSLQLLHTLKSIVSDKIGKSVVIAPFTGKISFRRFVDPQKQNMTGSFSYYISPDSLYYYAEAVIPFENKNQIRPGQQVTLHMPGGKHFEQIAVKGIIISFPREDAEKKWLVSMKLRGRLPVINYKEQVYGKVILNNKRLLQRITERIFFKV